MSNFDKDRFLRLRESAVFNMEAYRGSWQDQSSRRLAMTAVGTTWTQVNGNPAVSVAAPAQTLQSAATAGIVDPSADCTFEVLWVPNIGPASELRLFYQVSNGGVLLVWDETNNRVVLRLYNNVGAVTVSLSQPVGSTVRNRANHTIITSVSGGTVARSWQGGVPVTTTIAGAGALAPSGNTAILILQNVGTAAAVALRAYPFAFTNADAAALYGAAKSLVGEI